MKGNSGSAGTGLFRDEQPVVIGGLPAGYGRPHGHRGRRVRRRRRGVVGDGEEVRRPTDEEPVRVAQDVVEEVGGTVMRKTRRRRSVPTCSRRTHDDPPTAGSEAAGPRDRALAPYPRSSGGLRSTALILVNSSLFAFTQAASDWKYIR